MAARRQPLLEHVHRLAARLDPETDAVLLERFVRQRDEVAFEALVCRHGPMVLGVCRRVLGNAHDAEDVFQATFLVLSRKAASIRPPSSLPAWLHGVAHRLALKHRQTQRRRQNREARTAQAAEAVPSPDPLDQLTVREMFQALDEELQRLPASYRLPLILCWLEGRTQDEAADVLGWTLPSVKMRLHRGRALLHTRLARRGLVLGGMLAVAALGQGVAVALPPGLARATVEAALRLAAGGEVGVAAGVLALAEGALRLTGLKIVAVLLGITLVVSAGGVLARQIGAREETGPRPRVEESESGAQTPGQPEPESKAAARVDCHGDPLPPGALARLGTVRLRHNANVRSLVFTLDGKRLLTAGGDNFPRLWDMVTGKMLREFTNIPKPQINDVKNFCDVSAAALSPDGRLLAVRSGQTRNLYLLETTTGKRLHEFTCATGHAGNFSPYLNFAFSPDSRTIAAQLDGRLESRDTATGRILWQTNKIDLACKSITSLAYSPDGKVLACCGESDGVQLWDARTGKALRELGPQCPVFHLVFSPDCRTLAVGYWLREDQVQRNSVGLWDVATGKHMLQLGEPDKEYFSPVFSPDGKIVAAKRVGGIYLWEAATGKELHCFPNVLSSSGPPNVFSCSIPPAFSPDGKILAAMNERQFVHFWDVVSGQALSFRLPPGHDSAVNSLAITPDGQTLISAAADHTVRWWDTRTGRQRLCLPCQEESFPLSMAGAIAGWSFLSALSPDGTILAVASVEAPDKDLPIVNGWSTGIRLVESVTGKELRRLDSGVGRGMGLTFSPDGRLLAEVFRAAGGPSPVVRLWDVDSGKRREYGLDGICPLFSPDGRLLATADKEAIRFWETATGKQVHSIDTDERIWCLALSPDGTILATGSDRITLYPLSRDKSSGVQVGAPRSIAPSLGNVTALAFSPDGRMLASSGRDHIIHLWETASGKERNRFQGYNGVATVRSPGVASLCFTADGRRLASGSGDSTILIWDVTGRALKRLERAERR